MEEARSPISKEVPCYNGKLKEEQMEKFQLFEQNSLLYLPIHVIWSCRLRQLIFRCFSHLTNQSDNDIISNNKGLMELTVNKI